MTNAATVWAASLILGYFLLNVESRTDSASADAPESTHVLVLNDKDFDQQIKGRESVLVMFYAPWCGHCKKLKPEFDIAAKSLLENDPPIHLAKVDCTAEGKGTCSTYGVSGYPTLKIFYKGEMLKEYNGPRDADGIVDYMKRQVGPASTELAKPEALDNLLASHDDAVIVAFLEKDSELEKNFNTLASKLREQYKFAHSYSEELIKKYITDAEEGVVIFRPKRLSNKFEPDYVQYTTGTSVSEIEAFIKKNVHGLVGIRTPRNGEDFPVPLVVTYMEVDYVKKPKNTGYYRNRVMKVAKQFKDKYTFAVSDKVLFAVEMDEYGVSPSELPFVALLTADKKKYVLEEFSVEKFEQFLKDFEAGKLEPYLKSEEIPEDNSGPVKVAVAKNFDELVTKSNKDTLIEFYAPWCGHCKKLEPIYKELGEKMADEDVNIVKMDATANDVPSEFNVRGFPTLFWVPKDTKKPKSYEGGRELKDFISYIAKHATDELKSYDRKGEPKEVKEEL